MWRLRDDQWEQIRKHFPEERIPEGCPGRKPVSARTVLEAVLWILNTGAQWHMLPQCYPNYKRCIAAFSSGADVRCYARSSPSWRIRCATKARSTSARASSTRRLRRRRAGATQWGSRNAAKV
ncbi:MAG: transposase [Nitrospira sp.]|nr:transposase [Nitrospira sp.]